jgi:apolipoprotein N-acyltransferase
MKATPDSPAKAASATDGAGTASAVGAGAPPPAGGVLRDAGRILALYVLSAVALAWVFQPYGLWPLAFVALVPWTVATCRAHYAYPVHWLSFAVGWGFFLWSLRWLMPVTGLGYSALGLYLAIYWILAAWAIRTARRHGISPIWSLPIAWVACEYARATVMTGFPWLFVSHAFYQVLPYIQISDLVGAYGVSFVTLMVSGVLVELVLRRWPAPGPKTGLKQLVAGCVVTVILLVATLAYGVHRMKQVDFDQTPALRGPRVAVVQEDFPLRSTPPYGDHEYLILSTYLARAAEAARAGTDLVVFPETAWGAYQNLSFIARERAAIDDAHAYTWAYGKLCHDALSAFAQGHYAQVNAIIARLELQLRAEVAAKPDTRLPTTLPRLAAESGPPVTTVVGSVSIDWFPEATYPKSRRYNSALIYDADGRQREQRYDKRHLVPFGEFVPFRQQKWLGLDLHYWLYRPLNALSPFSYGGKIEYSLSAGKDYTIFELPVGERTYRFGTPICYEDTTPYVVRGFVWDGPARRADFLVNISNDGWFIHSNELPQHLAICVFRAVENRISIARAVNTGVSGFIDGNGRIYSRVTDARGRELGPGVVGYDCEPIYLDPRASLYGRTGDWFAGACAALTALVLLSAIFDRWVLAIKHRLAALLARKGGA